MNFNEKARLEINVLLDAAMRAAVEKGELPAAAEVPAVVEVPRDPAHGDFSSNFAMAAARAMHMPPRKIAEALLRHLDLSDSYFASAQIERKRSRDEAIDVLQLVVENPQALDESKSVAMAEISRIASDIDNESKIESLVEAKGFSRCIAVISNANASAATVFE